MLPRPVVKKAWPDELQSDRTNLVMPSDELTVGG